MRLSFMPDYIGFMHADKSFSVKKVRKFDNIYSYNGKDYIFDPSAIQIRKTLFGFKRYVFYQENRLTPIPDEPSNSKIQSLITAVEKDHTVAEFLHEKRDNSIMFFIIGSFGVVLGLAIGLIIAPHILTGMK